jgi:hypothetical protein
MCISSTLPQLLIILQDEKYFEIAGDKYRRADSYSKMLGRLVLLNVLLISLEFSLNSISYFLWLVVKKVFFQTNITL